MKIVRVTLSAGGTKFFFDRPFNPDTNDFENCDSALKFLTELCEQNKTIAVMYMTGGGQIVDGSNKPRHDPFLGAIPAIVNLQNISMLLIENAGVYDMEEKETSDE